MVHGMNNDFPVISCAEMISSAFSHIEKKDLEYSNQVFSAWTRILKSINSSNKETGTNLIAHSRIVDLKNGLLLIEADHPGWIELLQLHQLYILKGLHTYYPQLKINSLVYRLRGSNASLATEKKDISKERLRIEKKLEKEERDLKNKGFEINDSVPKKNLPDDLKKIFDNFRNDMLTNDR
jgi:hypothetical protein